MRTYFDLLTGTERPLHTDRGAVPWALPPAVWEVQTQGQLMDGLKAAGQSGGGTVLIDPQGIETDETVSLKSNTLLKGGRIDARNMKSGDHLLEVREGNKNVTVLDLVVNGHKNDVLCFPIHGDNVTLKDSAFTGCRTGPSAAGRATGLSFINVTSLNHFKWHGIALQDTTVRNYLVASCKLQGVGAYGLDSHASEGEAAGNLIFSNGQGESSYFGAGTKFPEADDLYFHNSRVENAGDGRGCIWVYGNPDKGERRPRNLRFYRCELIGGPHFNLHQEATVYHWGNTYYQRVALSGNDKANLKPVSVILRGTGQLVEMPSLAELPNYVVENPDTPPNDQMTEERVREIVRDEMGKPHSIYWN